MYIFQSVLRVLINLSVLAFAENPIAITNVEKIEIIYIYTYIYMYIFLTEVIIGLSWGFTPV